MRHLELRFTYVESPLLIALLFLAALAAVALAYGRPLRERPSVLVAALAALRFAAVSAALLCLLRPVVSFDILRRGEGRIVVLADRSRSMGVADSVGGETRIASAARLLEGAAMDRLGELFRLERFTFSSGGTLEPWTPPPRRPSGASEETHGGAPAPGLTAGGSSTDIAAALGAVSLDAGPIEAIVLVSDGRDHGREPAEGGDAAERLPSVPVHAVALGSSGADPPDLAWRRADCERKALRGNRVEVRGSISSRGLPAGRSAVSVRLDGKEVSRAEVDLKPGSNDVRLALVPDGAGELVYELFLEPRPGETVLENNRAHVPLDISEKRLEVLFFEGRARWAYKFARRALERDPSVNLTGLVKLGGERVLEQGKAPVSLEAGLPATRDGWRAFDALVLGNVVAEDFAPGDLDRIRAWVEADGGGLVYSGGAESHASLAAALGELLPVAPGSGERLAGTLAVVPSVSAIDHPITRGLQDLFAPGRPGGPFVLAEAFAAGGLRPGGEVLLAVSEADEQGRPGGDRKPLLAVRQHGKGRVAAYFTESDWRWVMERGEEGGARLFAALWGRMARWAARRDDEGAQGLAVKLSSPVVRAGAEVRVEVEGAADPSRLRVSVATRSGKRVQVPGGVEEGRWLGRIAVHEEGAHAVEAAGDPRGPARAALVVEPDTRELDDVSPDWDRLARIARQTGGRLLTLAEAATLADGIVKDTKSAVTHVELGAERSWVLYLALVAALGAEWMLRRKVLVV